MHSVLLSFFFSSFFFQFSHAFVGCSIIHLSSVCSTQHGVVNKPPSQLYYKLLLSPYYGIAKRVPFRLQRYVCVLWKMETCLLCYRSSSMPLYWFIYIRLVTEGTKHLSLFVSRVSVEYLNQAEFVFHSLSLSSYLFFFWQRKYDKIKFTWFPVTP